MIFKSAKEFLASKGIYALDTKKRTNEVLSWMEEYASQFRDKSVTELNERNSVDEVRKSFSLDELEIKLDEALNKETPESLKAWLAEQRK